MTTDVYLETIRLTRDAAHLLVEKIPDGEEETFTDAAIFTSLDIAVKLYECGETRAARIIVESVRVALEGVLENDA